jgi:hypothetical protein
MCLIFGIGDPSIAPPDSSLARYATIVSGHSHGVVSDGSLCYRTTVGRLHTIAAILHEPDSARYTEDMLSGVPKRQRWREIPAVLRTELYAVAALIGAAVVVIGRVLHVPHFAAALAGAVLCCGLRLMAMRRGWQLPIARSPQQSDQ